LISIIACMAQSRVIGSGSTLPWHLPEDMKRFRQLTTGHPVIMGRKTYSSIGGPLPNRTSIVVTRDEYREGDGSFFTRTISDALGLAKDSPGSKEIFIIGGGEIYKQTIDLVDKLYLTIIDKDIPGDTYFPEIDYNQFDMKDVKYFWNIDFEYNFLTLDRKKHD
jgi:dihydrofolate reductase